MHLVYLGGQSGPNCELKAYRFRLFIANIIIDRIVGTELRVYQLWSAKVERDYHLSGIALLGTDGKQLVVLGWGVSPLSQGDLWR